MKYDFLKLDSLKQLYEDTGNYPKYFGLGFFQLKLNDSNRIHYYHADLKPILHEEEVHDHRYWFFSNVLKGSLTNKIWYYEPTLESEWELCHVHCKEGVDDAPIIVNSNVKKIFLSQFCTEVGQSYSLSEDAFHQVYHKGHVVTELVRALPVKTYARVIRNKNDAYICPYSAPVSIDKTWEYLKDMLD